MGKSGQTDKLSEICDFRRCKSGQLFLMIFFVDDLHFWMTLESNLFIHTFFSNQDVKYKDINNKPSTRRKKEEEETGIPRSCQQPVNINGTFNKFTLRMNLLHFLIILLF